MLAGAVGAALVAMPNHAQAANNELAPKHINLTVQKAKDATDAQAAEDQANAKAKRPPPGPTSNGISYHGGPLILGGTNAYVIWYGSWGNTNTTLSLVPAFLSGVNKSPYFNINTTYYDGSNVHVANAVAFAGQTTVSAPLGTTLSDSGVQAVVANAISSGQLPKDTNGVYFVLTSGDVKESSGFLTQYCGWHTRGTISGSDIKYAFVGDASASLSSCAAQTTKSPNNNPAGDAMISVIAHELEEATTDPDLNAWYDTHGAENADKCAWTFGTTFTAANGSKYNMTLGTTNFLIQQNWVNASGGYCNVKYP